MTIESSYGMWWDPDEPENKVAGHLTWEPLRTPTLSLLDPPTRMWAGANLADGQAMALGEQFVPILHGTLADRGAVTLLASQFGGMTIGRTSTHRLSVGRVLLGVWLDAPDEAFLRRVEVDLPALEALLGRYPVRPDRRLTPRSRQVRLMLYPRRHSWKDGAVEVTWEYRMSASVDSTTTQVTMTPTVVLTSTTPRSVDYWLDDWINPINLFLEIVTGTKSNPRSVTVWMKKRPKGVTSLATQIPLWTRGVGDHEYTYEQRQVLLSLEAIKLNPDGLPDVIRQTNRLSTEQEIFLGLLSGAIVSSERPMRNRYLDLMSGLEAYHSQVHGVAAISLDEFAAKRKAAVDAVRSATIEPAHQRFIKRWLLNRPSYPLEHRLRELARNVRVLERWQVSPQQMAALRNDVAHGNALIDPGLVRTAYGQAFDLARLLVLAELGIVDRSSA